MPGISREADFVAQAEFSNGLLVLDEFRSPRLLPWSLMPGQAGRTVLLRALPSELCPTAVELTKLSQLGVKSGIFSRVRLPVS